ncbi:MAG: thioredoxin fold domain-containing protein, partial [Acidithiobacillus sp.]|nr:thioredoxin fold domain-containing protein [Acidithiobacillus sp.]
NGKYVFMGGIFDASGKNYSVTYAHKYLPAADLPHVVSPVAMGKAVTQTTNFLIGNPAAKKSVWMVADPNCIFCHLAWEHLKPYVDKGDLKIHLIPVGFLKPSSLDKAATILESKDAARAWRYDEAHFNVQEEEGGIIPPLPAGATAEAKKNPKFEKMLDQVQGEIEEERKAGLTIPKTLSPENVKAIQANNAWMNQHGISGTPFLVYQDSKGQWAVQPGMPQNTQAFVAGISGK